MKMVIAVIQPPKLKPVRHALAKIGVERLTICDAMSFGRPSGQTKVFRGRAYKPRLLRKIQLEIVVNDDFLDRTIETIQSIARTGPEGSIGDGKIFVLPLDEAVRIGETVKGKEAV